MALTKRVAVRQDHTDMPGAVDPPSAINDPYITDTGTGPEWAEREHGLGYHTDVTIVDPADDDILQYNLANLAWENTSLALATGPAVVPLTTTGVAGDPELVWDDNDELVMTEVYV